MAKSGTITIWLVDKAPRSDFFWGEGSMFAVANYLTDYFNQICRHRNSPFENARCTWQKGVPGEADLVIYFVETLEKGIIKTKFNAISNCTAPSGGTFESSQGMVSEVYMDSMQGDANYSKVVANLAFHELMHNKLDAPTDNQTIEDLHASGGGGLAEWLVNRSSSLTAENIMLMAGALNKKILQYTAGMNAG
jgi:hypothetical protein